MICDSRLLNAGGSFITANFLAYANSFVKIKAKILAYPDFPSKTGENSPFRDIDHTDLLDVKPARLLADKGLESLNGR